MQRDLDRLVRAVWSVRAKALLLPKRERRWKKPDALPYQWAIEGDIKGCFDNIGHHGLMQRIRRRVADAKLNRLVIAFLKAGILSEAQFLRAPSGTPQGGILSPLLANVALSAIDERYERHAWPRGIATRRSHVGRPSKPLTEPDAIARRAFQNRGSDKRRGFPVYVPIRYADDFIILVHEPTGFASGQIANQEKTALANVLERELELTLAEDKRGGVGCPLLGTGIVEHDGEHMQYRPASKNCAASPCCDKRRR